MTNEVLTPLRAFVEAYATQSTENADQLIHEYMCKKSKSLINIGTNTEDEETDTTDDKSVDINK